MKRFALVGQITSIVALTALLLFGTLTTPASADYAAQAALAVNETFVLRVKMAGIDAAIDIASESDTTFNHQRRVAFAEVFLQNPDALVSKLAFGVAADPTITAGSSDAVLKNRVAAIWNAFAGQPPQ